MKTKIKKNSLKFISVFSLTSVVSATAIALPIALNYSNNQEKIQNNLIQVQNFADRVNSSSEFDLNANSYRNFDNPKLSKKQNESNKINAAFKDFIDKIQEKISNILSKLPKIKASADQSIELSTFPSKQEFEKFFLYQELKETNFKYSDSTDLERVAIETPFFKLIKKAKAMVVNETFTGGDLLLEEIDKTTNKPVKPSGNDINTIYKNTLTFENKITFLNKIIQSFDQVFSQIKSMNSQNGSNDSILPKFGDELYFDSTKNKFVLKDNWYQKASNYFTSAIATNQQSSFKWYKDEIEAQKARDLSTIKRFYSSGNLISLYYSTYPGTSEELYKNVNGWDIAFEKENPYFITEELRDKWEGNEFVISPIEYTVLDVKGTSLKIQQNIRLNNATFPWDYTFTSLPEINESRNNLINNELKRIKDFSLIQLRKNSENRRSNSLSIFDFSFYNTKSIFNYLIDSVSSLGTGTSFKIDFSISLDKRKYVQKHANKLLNFSTTQNQIVKTGSLILYNFPEIETKELTDDVPKLKFRLTKYGANVTVKEALTYSKAPGIILLPYSNDGDATPNTNGYQYTIDRISEARENGKIIPNAIEIEVKYNNGVDESPTSYTQIIRGLASKTDYSFGPFKQPKGIQEIESIGGDIGSAQLSKEQLKIINGIQSVIDVSYDKRDKKTIGIQATKIFFSNDYISQLVLYAYRQLQFNEAYKSEEFKIKTEGSEKDRDKNLQNLFEKYLQFEISKQFLSLINSKQSDIISGINRSLKITEDNFKEKLYQMSFSIKTFNKIINEINNVSGYIDPDLELEEQQRIASEKKELDNIVSDIRKFTEYTRIKDQKKADEITKVISNFSNKIATLSREVENIKTPSKIEKLVLTTESGDVVRSRNGFDWFLVVVVVLFGIVIIVTAGLAFFTFFRTKLSIQTVKAKFGVLLAIGAIALTSIIGVISLILTIIGGF